MTTRTKALPSELEPYRGELVRRDFTEFAYDGRHLWGRRPDGLWQGAFGVTGGM